MARTGTTVDITELPSARSGGAKNRERQAAYGDIVRPLNGADMKGKAIVVELDEGETQKGVALALVYAGQRLGMELRAWAVDGNRVAVRHITDKELEARTKGRKSRVKTSPDSAGAASPENAKGSTNGKRQPAPAGSR